MRMPAGGDLLAVVLVALIQVEDRLEERRLRLVHLGRDGLAMGDDLVFGGPLPGGQGQQHGVIAEAARDLCLGHRLRGAADRTTDQDRGVAAFGWRCRAA